MTFALILSSPLMAEENKVETCQCIDCKCSEDGHCGCCRPNTKCRCKENNSIRPACCQARQISE